MCCQHATVDSLPTTTAPAVGDAPLVVLSPTPAWAGPAPAHNPPSPPKPPPPTRPATQWREVRSAQGVYYVNMATNATQWERPPGAVMLWGEGPHRPAPMRKGASMR